MRVFCIPKRSNTAKKAYYPKRFYRAATLSRITSVASRISQTRYDIARNFLVATTVVGLSTESNCESRPQSQPAGVLTHLCNRQSNKAACPTENPTAGLVTGSTRLLSYS
jgi:hypothetical protein